MPEAELVARDRVLYEKSVQLRVYSGLLRLKAHDLCLKSSRLRERNTVSALIDPLRWRQRAHPSFVLPASLAIADSSESCRPVDAI